MVANILLADPPTPPPPPQPLGRVNRSKFIFLDHVHVAYQIKGNHEMQQHGSKCFGHRPLPHDPRRWSQTGPNSTFSEHSHVAYQIKWNHECSNMVANILPTYPPTPPPPPPHPTLGMKSIGQNSTFSEHGHVAYQIKWNHEM